MKARVRRGSGFWLGACGYGCWSLVAAQPSPALPALRDRMRAKLHFAQGVLEGLTTEKFALVTTNAGKLAQLARSPDWRVQATAEYAAATAEFLRQTDALTRAAQEQSVEAATGAYFQLTLSCVNCHRQLRGVQTVRFPGAPAEQFQFRIPQPLGGPVTAFP